MPVQIGPRPSLGLTEVDSEPLPNMTLKFTLGEGDATCNVSHSTLHHPDYPNQKRPYSRPGLDNTRPLPEHRQGLPISNGLTKRLQRNRLLNRCQ